MTSRALVVDTDGITKRQGIFLSAPACVVAFNVLDCWSELRLVDVGWFVYLGFIRIIVIGTTPWSTILFRIFPDSFLRMWPNDVHFGAVVSYNKSWQGLAKMQSYIGSNPGAVGNHFLQASSSMVLETRSTILSGWRSF